MACPSPAMSHAEIYASMTTEKTIQHKLFGFDYQDNLEVIDALRGYAILLVITVHSLGYVPELVWPVKRLFTLGFYGVQLFFIASAVTLLMSWHRGEGAFGARVSKFLIRRFFRIAPFYYVAIMIYWLAYRIPPNEFNLDVLVASLLFYNAWSPYLIPTVPGWTPVPGGWSIGVEFCFYFIFPVLAISVTSLKRALAFCIISLVVLIFGYSYGQGLYPGLSQEAKANFLYFWPPNHLVIFAFGFLVYHLIKSESAKKIIFNSRLNGDHASFILAAFIVLISMYGVRKFFDLDTFMPPTHLLVSVCFVPWVLFFVLKPGKYSVNPLIVGLGKVSFSAYILHFAVLRYSDYFLGKIWPSGKSGAISIAYEMVLLLLALLMTRFAAGLSYRFIEQPFMNIGKRIARLL